ncbi:unnamed protein product [Diabrotica balteata]|uniref:Multiple inositol polyphosphate phosphatase 1 n=1 Tax=Diabrotica balteata TaxID=107213 RepID=A0A9N9SR14_DIABA|nr:unnamed protein product [Diabrotica balteata]
MIYLKISTACLLLMLVAAQDNYPNYNNQNNNNQNYNPSNQNYNPQNNYDRQNGFTNPQNNFNGDNPNYSNPNYNNNNNNNNNFNNNNQNFNNQNFNSQPTDQGDCCEDYCYVNDHEPYLYFGTKTAYDSLNRRGGNQHVIPDCRPVQFWSIIRHGAELPDSDTIRTMRNMNKLHEDILRNHEQRRTYPDKGRLCPTDYDLFKRWRFNESINEGRANGLSEQGRNDLKLLARRYKTKYSEILQNYDSQSYSFQHSPENRESFEAYITGLFDDDVRNIVHANILNGDRLTRPTQNCPRWQEIESSQFQIGSELQRFKERQDYQKMVRDVFRRLGYRFTLNATVIDDIYNLCRYEKAWNPQPKSPWCVAFNKNQLKVLEYAEDLKYFFEAGYGNRMSERIGCNPLKDFYERFERTVNGNNDGNKASFIFTQTETFLSTLVALGIAKDYNPLTAENYMQQSRRNWKTSTISPFAANLVATLYECNRDEKYRVVFFLNESPVEFQECSVGLCNWSTVQQKYQDLVRNCDINKFCNGNSSAGVTYATFSLFVLMSILALRL